MQLWLWLYANIDEFNDSVEITQVLAIFEIILKLANFYNQYTNGDYLWPEWTMQC